MDIIDERMVIGQNRNGYVFIKIMFILANSEMQWQIKLL